jgi:hypothetical protein
MNTMRLCLLTACVLADAAWSQIPDADVRRCSAVGAATPIAFQGRTLVEIPDVTDAGLRRANLLLSSRCRDDALEMLEAYVAEHGPDAQATYVAARYIWITAGKAQAQVFIEEYIDTFPDFVSAKVLLASLHAAEFRFDEAAAILDDVERDAPSDLWIFLNRLRIAALTEPSLAAVETLLAVLHDSSFPPNARDAAADIVKHSPNVPLPQFEEAMSGVLEFESALPTDCKVTNYSIYLTESWNRFDDARVLLEKYSGHDGPCWRSKGRMYLAYVYLVDAANRAPVPTLANAELVARASALVDGDFSGLASWLLQRPQEQRLRPFISPKLATNAVDQYRRTLLCSALIGLQAATVKAEIERGADPNEQCSGSHPVNLILLMGLGDRLPEGDAVLRVLLAAGARPSEVIDCTHPHETQCAGLVPTLREYGLL